MYHVLLVDDETYVVDSLASTVPWQELGVEEIHKSYSAAEALQVLERQSIDIVMTDIRMPEMDGLELIQHIRIRHPNIKIVIVSGHADFEYAKQALANQVDDYLLKPVRDEEFHACIQRLIRNISEEWQTKSSYERALSGLHANLPVLRAKLLEELLHGRTYADPIMAEKLELLKLPFEVHEDVALVLIRIEDEWRDLHANDIALYEFGICNIAEEIFMERHFRVWHCSDDHDYIVMLLKLRGKNKAQAKYGDGFTNYRKELLDRTASRLQQCVRQYLKRKISIILTNWVPLNVGVFKLYQHALHTVRRKIGMENELFITSDIQVEQEGIRSLKSMYEPPLLVHILEAGRWEEAEQKLHRIFDELEQDWNDSQEHVLEAFFTITAAYSHIVHRNGKLLIDLIGPSFGFISEWEGNRSINQFKEWSLEVLGNIRDDLKQEMSSTRGAVIQKLQRYVESESVRHYSLQELADHVHLHPVYLSKIYKLETGENISDFLFRFRMEKAAELLRTTNMRIYEISEKLAYQNAQYFIRLFKTYYGKTPQEFRVSMEP